MTFGVQTPKTAIPIVDMLASIVETPEFQVKWVRVYALPEGSRQRPCARRFTPDLLGHVLAREPRRASLPSFRPKDAKR